MDEQPGGGQTRAAADELNDLLHELTDRLVEAYPKGRVQQRLAYGSLIFAPPSRRGEHDDLALAWMSPRGRLMPIFNAPAIVRVEATHAIFVLEHTLRSQRDEVEQERAVLEAVHRLRDWLHGHPVELLKRTFKTRFG